MCAHCLSAGSNVWLIDWIDLHILWYKKLSKFYLLVLVIIFFKNPTFPFSRPMDLSTIKKNIENGVSLVSNGIVLCALLKEN